MYCDRARARADDERRGEEGCYHWGGAEYCLDPSVCPLIVFQFIPTTLSPSDTDRCRVQRGSIEDHAYLRRKVKFRWVLFYLAIKANLNADLVLLRSKLFVITGQGKQWLWAQTRSFKVYTCYFIVYCLSESDHNYKHLLWNSHINTG